MYFIELATGKYPISLSEIKRMVNVSFGDNVDYQAFGFALVQFVQPPSCTPLQKVVELTPKKINNVWLQQWWVEDLAGDELSTAEAMVVAKEAYDLISAGRDKAFNDYLPSWAKVEDAINNISSLAEAKAFIAKLSRVVYYLAKNRID